MKIILYRLAGISFLVVLALGSCVFWVDYKIASNIPDYATVEYFNSNYSDDIRSITEHIKNDEAIEYNGSNIDLNEDIVAVLSLKKDDKSMSNITYEDIYKKFLVKKDGGHSLSNNIGVTDLIVSDVQDIYLVQEIEVNEFEYWICFNTQNNP